MCFKILCVWWFVEAIANVDMTWSRSNRGTRKAKFPITTNTRLGSHASRSSAPSVSLWNLLASGGLDRTDCRNDGQFLYFWMNDGVRLLLPATAVYFLWLLQPETRRMVLRPLESLWWLSVWPGLPLELHQQATSPILLMWSYRCQRIYKPSNVDHSTRIRMDFAKS